MMIRDEQVIRYMQLRATGTTQAQAAIKRGMHVKTARRYERAGKLPSELKTPRTWVTRPNPFAEDWPWVVEALILDDSGYVQQAREEMEVFFTLLAPRYERRSVLISSNLVFSQWQTIFTDPLITLAAIDRVVHHAVLLDRSGIASYRANQAQHQVAPVPG